MDRVGLGASAKDLIQSSTRKQRDDVALEKERTCAVRRLHSLIRLWKTAEAIQSLVPFTASVAQTEGRNAESRITLALLEKTVGRLQIPKVRATTTPGNPLIRWSVYGERQNTVTSSGRGVWQSADYRANPV